MAHEELPHVDAQPSDLPLCWPKATDHFRVGTWRIAIEQVTAWWKELSQGRHIVHVRDPGCGDGAEPPKTEEAAGLMVAPQMFRSAGIKPYTLPEHNGLLKLVFEPN